MNERTNSSGGPKGRGNDARGSQENMNRKKYRVTVLMESEVENLRNREERCELLECVRLPKFTWWEFMVLHINDG